MATAQNSKSSKPVPTSRVAGATPPPKSATPAAAKPEEKKEAEKAAKPPKPQKPVLDKTYGRVAKVARSITKVLGTVQQFTGQGTDEQKEIVGTVFNDLKTALALANGMLEPIAKLKTSGFNPTVAAAPGGGGGGRKKPELAPNIQVWVKPKRHAEYLKAFDAAALEQLFVDKIIGTKALIRIGEPSSEGKVARMIGFVPKGHVTTVKPLPAPTA